MMCDDRWLSISWCISVGEGCFYTDHHPPNQDYPSPEGRPLQRAETPSEGKHLQNANPFRMQTYNGQTNTCRTITFPHTLYVVGKNPGSATAVITCFASHTTFWLKYTLTSPSSIFWAMINSSNCLLILNKVLRTLRQVSVSKSNRGRRFSSG